MNASVHAEPLPSEAEPMGEPIERWALSLSVAVDFTHLLEVLWAPSNMPRFHPLITGVTEAPERVEASKIIRDFEVVERLPLVGPLSVRNRYRGRVCRDAKTPGQLRLSGWSTPAVRIEALHQYVDGVYVEKVWFTAPWPVRRFVRSQLLAAHWQLMNALVAFVTERGRHP